MNGVVWWLDIGRSRGDKMRKIIKVWRVVESHGGHEQGNGLELVIYTSPARTALLLEADPVSRE